MDKLITAEKAFTHGGSFHADDVISGAFLKLLNPDIVLERGFNVPENYEGIVFDIGNGVFDHHSVHREIRETGVYYAAFGKLWRGYSNLLVSDYVSKAIDEEFISPIDNSDNTGERELLSSVIYNMNPFWNEKNTEDIMLQSYLNAVDFAKGILERYIEKFKAIERAQGYVLSRYIKSDGKIVVLDKYAPWRDILKRFDIKAVVYPSNRGGWNVERIENSGFEFPKKWWGSRDSSIAKGFVFCHATGFLSNFVTLEDAMSAILPLMKGSGYGE